METVWVLMASRSGARIFARNLGADEIRLVESIENPEGRLKAGEINQDRPGRTYNSIGTQRHAFSPSIGADEQIAIDFAKKVAGVLERGRQEGRFEALAIAAAPRFLGLLREHLNPSLCELIALSLSKNFQNESDHDVLETVCEIVHEIDHQSSLAYG